MQAVVYVFDLTGHNIKNKRQILRNCVNPDLGLHILQAARQEVEPISANDV